MKRSWKLIIQILSFYKNYFLSSFPWNPVNFFALFLRILELYSIATLAFAPYIDWGLSSVALNIINSSSYFHFFLFLLLANGEIDQ